MAQANGSIDSYVLENPHEKISCALLDSKKDWSIKYKTRAVDLNKFVEFATKTKMTGFYHNEMFFILSDNVPDKFRPCVILHESTEKRLEGIAEENILDLSYYEDKEEREKFIIKEMESARRYPHQQACIAELSHVFHQGKEFTEEYANWLKETNWDLDNPITFFNQAIPNYLKENNRVSDNPLKVLIDFYIKLKHDSWSPELRKAALNKFPWIKSFEEEIK
jgi:hypothetical protein